MDKYTYYVKTGALCLLLLMCSTLLFSSITELVQSKNYLSLGTGVYVTIFILMYLTSVIASLTLGAWNKWIQYIIVPLPIVVGMFINIYSFNLDAALLIAVLAYLVIAESVYLSYRLKDLLIKEDPRYMLKNMVKAILFTVSITAGVVTLLYLLKPTNLEQMTKKLDDFIINVYDTSIKQILKSQMDSTLSQSFYNALPQEVATDEFGNVILPAVKTVTQSMDDTIKTNMLAQFHKVIEPYKSALPVIAGLLVWSILQFISWFASAVYTLTIGMVFNAAKRFGLFKVTMVDIKKEVLSF